MKSILREYRQELVVMTLAGMAGIGLFAFSRYEGSLADLPSVVIGEISQFSQTFSAWLRRALDSIGIMTLVVSGTVVLALLYIVVRIRYHWRNNENIHATNCPRCGADIYRVHRRPFDRLLSATLLPSARRYRCANHDCKWTGLRRRRHHEHLHHAVEGESS